MTNADPQNHATPLLSVIVTIVDGGETLTHCLNALAAQEDAPPMEVIIPFDATLGSMGDLIVAYPDFAFLDLGTLVAGVPRNAFEHHVLFDKRRSGGLLRAKGALLAMIEDRGAPESNWAKEMADAHRCYDDGVIGGAVESGAKGMVRWAIFFVDFGRYQAPFDTAHPEYVTDTNICYKRAALESVEELWRDKYQESVVNWALREAGAGLRLVDGPKTLQRRIPIGFVALAMERVHWGRTYGEVRARGVSFAGRLKWIAITPLLPLILYIRHTRRQLRIGRHMKEYWLSTPTIIYLLIFWSFGELMGYFEAKGPKRD